MRSCVCRVSCSALTRSPPDSTAQTDECSKIFGGLDILSIDAVVDEKGNHTILGTQTDDGDDGVSLGVCSHCGAAMQR